MPAAKGGVRDRPGTPARPDFEHRLEEANIAEKETEEAGNGQQQPVVGRESAGSQCPWSDPAVGVINAAAMISRKNVTASEPTRLPAAVTASAETVHRIAVASAASSPRCGGSLTVNRAQGEQGLGDALVLAPQEYELLGCRFQQSGLEG